MRIILMTVLCAVSTLSVSAQRLSGEIMDETCFRVEFKMY